jgi:hypothetical protein
VQLIYSNAMLVCDVCCTNNDSGIAFTIQYRHSGMNMAYQIHYSEKNMPHIYICVCTRACMPVCVPALGGGGGRG